MIPVFFFQVFAKNGLVKNIFEESTMKQADREKRGKKSQAAKAKLTSKGGKFLKMLWCWEYYKIIWFYQLS